MNKVNTIVNGIVSAVLIRMGTALAVWLASFGIPDELVQQVIVAVGMLGAVAFDIAMALLLRRRV